MWNGYSPEEAGKKRKEKRKEREKERIKAIPKYTIYTYLLKSEVIFKLKETFLNRICRIPLLP